MAVALATNPADLLCLGCKLPLNAPPEGGRAVCTRCEKGHDFVFFPARRRAKPVARAVTSLEGEATCYFHAQNQAGSVCDDCGRYLCVVCELPAEEGGTLCPPCVANRRKKTPQKADEVVCYDLMAMTLALLPLLMWPFTIVTAPTAIGMAIYGWRKPRSLVRPGRWRLVVALALATLQLGGWIFFGLTLWADL